MKKTLLAATLLASFGMASTVMATPLPVGSATMQWAGSVPAETVSGAGYWIVQDGGLGFTDGILTFKNDAKGGIALNSASEIGFKVVKDEGVVGTLETGIDIAPLGYDYTLTNVKVGINGLAVSQPVDGYFAVHADGDAAASVVGTLVTNKKAKGEPTRLSIKPSATGKNTLASGDDVVLMAVLSVAADDAAI